ncbi:MAG: extracellular solute-binding protein [Alphaproteobacteria bacterium]|nr:extracellular solute-binding protein [Alphaproteobacteria bacterium]
MIRKYLFASFISLLALNAEARELKIYNWSNFISEDTIKNFEKATDINVKYDVYDSDHALDARLYVGKIGYDIVVPSAFPFLKRQKNLGLYQKIDKSKLKNYKNLDPLIMDKMKEGGVDEYGVPWMWGTVGIGYNKEAIQKIMPGKDLNSLKYFFNKNNIKQLEKCGVMMMDAPNEILPMIYVYLGLNPNSEKPEDLEQVGSVLSAIRPHVKQFHSSRYIDALVNGEVCAVIGFSGDIMQAKYRAAELNKPFEIAYVIPEEGTQLWIDSFAIPENAKNVNEAYEFLDYLLKPEVAAENSNNLGFANANKLSKDFLNDNIVNNKSIYLTPKDIDKTYILQPLSLHSEKLRSKLWIRTIANH